MEMVLTHCQQRALERLMRFLDDKNAKAFILKGYAGTGKTTMMRKFIEELSNRRKNVLLLASTGRAAKILANTTGRSTRTVHSEIYQFADLNNDLEKMATERETHEIDKTGQLLLNFGLVKKQYLPDEEEIENYYIVDEASMLSDMEEKSPTQAVFGSGKVLTDLLTHDAKGRYIFVGDYCQLPPINQRISPALTAEYLKEKFSIEVYEAELTQIVRQGEGNDIALSAQKIRQLYASPQPWKWAKFPMKGYSNIHLLNSQTELINRYIQTVKEHGYNEATLLCFSNKQCDITTQILRPAFGHQTSQLETGDLLLVTQNNLLTGLMNGDLVTITEVMTMERRAGLTFVKVEVKELFTGRVYSQFLIADVLYSDQTNLTQAQHKELFMDFYYRMKDKGIKQKSDEFKRQMLNDPYLNALRAVFGYALTCHKAQGGEWNNVYLDIPKSVPALHKPYVYQWIYTAMTRTKQELYIVNDFWIM